MNKQMMRKAQQGFTLIELMIVVAIIGILAAVAIPQYQNYVIRAKIGNALTAVDSLKTAVALCSQENGGVMDSCDTTAAGAETTIPEFTPTKEVASATVADGVITATLAADIGEGVSGKEIKWEPTTSETSTNLVWTIDASDIDNTAIKAMVEKTNKTGS
ncbi:prepilin peptidase-dependent pilin [Comamonas faecalis]|uniref:Prepilin peptidase-dependent pilin n=1 Tax=Comamonas faecalis TaxID=1387849 RepID=A0ABP7RQX7_9BURK